MIERLEVILEEELNARRYFMQIPVGAPFSDVQEVIKAFSAKVEEMAQRAQAQAEEQAKAAEAPAEPVSPEIVS